MWVGTGMRRVGGRKELSLDFVQGNDRPIRYSDIVSVHER